MIEQAEYVSLKRKLNVKLGKLRRSVPNYCVPVREEDDPRIPIYRAILEECSRAFTAFDAQGYPDDWSLWQNAADDAVWQLGHFYPGELLGTWGS